MPKPCEISRGYLEAAIARRLSRCSKSLHNGRNNQAESGIKPVGAIVYLCVVMDTSRIEPASPNDPESCLCSGIVAARPGDPRK